MPDPNPTPGECAQALFKRTGCTCGLLTPDDVADAIAAAVLAERDVCLDFVRHYAGDCDSHEKVEIET